MIPRCRPLLLAAGLPLLLAACSMFQGSTKDPAADRVRAELSQLQADTRLSSRVPVPMKDAEDAVNAAEVPQKDPALSNHLVYIAERKVQTARALAEARVADDQLKALGHGP